VKPLQLSIIIPAYNSRKTIERCLQSLVNQIDDETMEIIVVESSGDGTAAFIAERFPKVKVYTLLWRKFAGGARNFGISKARMDWGLPYRYTMTSDQVCQVQSPA